MIASPADEELLDLLGLYSVLTVMSLCVKCFHNPMASCRYARHVSDSSLFDKKPVCDFILLMAGILSEKTLSKFVTLVAYFRC